MCTVLPYGVSTVDTVPMSAPLDELDARLLSLLHERPQVGVLGASRELGVARGTVQSRLDRMVRRGIIATFAPHLDPAALGYPVTAFVTLQIRQGRKEDVLRHVASIPQVLEAHTITGSGDLVLRVVASDNADLQAVIDGVVSDAHVDRSSTVIALSTHIDFRVMPLVERYLPSGG